MDIFKLVDALEDHNIDSVKGLREILAGVEKLQEEIERLDQSQRDAVNEISGSFAEAVFNLG